MRPLFCAALPMLEEDAKAAAHSCLQDSQSRLARVLRAGNLGGGQLSVEMRLGGWMSGAKRALLFRFSSAHGATDGQYLSQREFPRVSHQYYSTSPILEMVNLALLGFQVPQNGTNWIILIGMVGVMSDVNFVALQQHCA